MVATSKKGPKSISTIVPPNAAISVLGETDEAPAIVELTSAQMDGTSLKYGIKVLSGKLPESAQNVAVFVDHGPHPHGHPVSGHQVRYYPYGPYHPYHPYHPVPGPYCYHAPQDPECHYHPYHPYPPYPPYPPYYPGAAFATGAIVGAAAASANQQPQQVYIYPIPASGVIPAHCYINSNHTRMICSVPLPQ